MDRSNHYEKAFEAYLQARRLAHVAVDETRRSFDGEEQVKSLDAIICGAGGARLLVDVKGRRYPAGPADQPRRVWECWSPREDVDSLSRWAERFGTAYRSLLVFMYEVLPSAPALPDGEEVWEHDRRRYVLRGVDVADYRRWMRRRSPKWDTVTLSSRVFRFLARPFPEFLRPPASAAAEQPATPPD
jgi:hypothetical protein